MAEMTPFKEQINAAAVEDLAAAIASVHSGFAHRAFSTAVTARLDELELKDRVRHVAAELHTHLPPDFPEAAAILVEVAGRPAPGGMIAWSFCQFVEERGLGHFEESMAALHDLTSRFSAEFAIRPFLLEMPERTLERLMGWTSDADHHVRRLVSEGTRTRLPWGQQLPHFIADPNPVFALLERLRDDPELYVRRSVANSLNDLSKDHPARVVDVAGRWMRDGGEDHAWMTRHALRTLVKKGDPGALGALGYGAARVELQRLHASDRVEFGQAVEFEFSLASTARKSQRLMIDYAIHHVKANGSRTAKVFKWSKRSIAPGATLKLARRHVFRAISTRRYYPGMHAVEVLVNGRSLGLREFELVL